MSGFFNSTRRAGVLAAAFLPLVVNLGGVFADEKPAAPTTQPAPSVQPPKPVFDPVPQGGFKINQIGDTLRSLGYKVEPQLSSAGVTFYSLTIERGDWTYHLNVSLSLNSENIWANAPLARIDEKSTPNPAALLKLLGKNQEMAPFLFKYDAASSHMLCLAGFCYNHNMTPSSLKRLIDESLDTIKETYPLWNPTTLGTPTATVFSMRKL